MGDCVRTGSKCMRCQECGAEIRPWEDVYSWDANGGGELVCEDCFDGMLGELSRYEKAELMGRG